VLKIILLLFMLFSTAFAYRVGDRLDSSVTQKLAMQKDTIYVLNFFASWCSSCKKELPLINQLPQGINVIGINIDKERAKGESFVKELKLDFTILYDSDNAVVQKFDPVGVPAIYFIKNGQVIAQRFGALNQIDQFILNTIKEQK